ncbi:MAG: hypothetical protein LPJ87_00795 [Zoogloeaceae bacterium]|nr:hypothetical protein [Zoogloeaceae bacterium]
MLIEFTNFMVVLWEGLVNFLNSSFVSASLSALAGAGFGLWGAQRFAERSVRRKELLDALAQANSILVLAVTIANQAFSLKSQHISPLAEQYFKDRDVAIEMKGRLDNGELVEYPHFHIALTKITPLTVPIETLKSLTFSAQLMPGRILALVSMVEQFITELTYAINSRSEMIDSFHSSGLAQHIRCLDYYGLTRPDGNTNAMYHDTMVAVSQYLDDVTFFATELAEELQKHALHLREKLLEIRSDAPEAYSVDFSRAHQLGLIPPRENYESWLSGFQSKG